ncbi:MAG: sulfatase family protein [Planctomycetota bacterium]
MTGNPLKRRDFLKAALGGAALTCAPSAGRAKEKPRCNVIFCFSDEHRWQSMSFTEMPRMVTPYMKRLAEQGVSFDNAISNYPVCSPYRAIIMTGRWPYQQKVTDGSPGVIDNNHPLSPDQPTIGRAFKRAGYATGYIGKWHLGGTRAEPFGFDLSLIWSGTNNHWRSKYHPKGGAAKACTRYNATAMTDQALEFIEANARRPFFLMLSINPPHSSFTDAPKEKMALYRKPGLLSLRPNVKQTGGGKRKGGAKSYQGYHAHISAVDDELGRIMARLDRLGIAKDTLLVYSSDHGTMFGSHGVGSKRQPYEESIKVPFIARLPGRIPAGRRSKVLFGAIDVMPSLLSLAGIAAPDTCSGRDLSSAMLGTKGPEPASQFIMHISKKKSSKGNRHPAPIFRGVTTGRYTLAVCPDRPDMLFDNEKDPYQMKNLFDDASMAGVRRKLEAELARWLKKAGDPFKLPG